MKTVYTLRVKEGDQWSDLLYFKKKKARDKAGSLNRVFGGFATLSSFEKVTKEKFDSINFEE